MPGVFGSIVEAAPGGGLRLDLDPVAKYTAILREQGVKPLYSWAYTPKPLQGPVDLALVSPGSGSSMGVG